MEFKEFNLNEKLLEGLNAAGYENCTDVQEQVLKNSQDGSDLYVQSQTGTGKTAAYLVAVIQQMLSKNDGKKALVMVPTRELAVQVEEEAKVLISASGLKTFSFFGGVGYEKQIAAYKKGVDIIIGTPGRLIDLCEANNLNFSDVGYVVIDEADRMFDMGFQAELRKILKFVPNAEERQTMLFSATLNTYVKYLAYEYTREPKEIEIECENITVSEIAQELLHVSSDEKMKLLIGILKNENPASVIIFCNTKRSCEVVAKRLEMNELNARFIIGDLPQPKRLSILKDFKAGKTTILVATDVAARGIDVDNLAMVINYDLPNEAENYVHRIGRTARAGKSGKAYTFCSEQDVYNLPAIERYIEMKIPANVAYPDQMSEDKSAGIYIKTENRNDDYEDSHGGFKSGYHKNHSRKNHGKSEHYHGKGGKYGERNGNKEYKKKLNYYDKKRKSFEELKNIEGMSFDERMKFYKEKYGNLSAKSSYSKDSKKTSGKRYDSSVNNKQSPVKTKKGIKSMSFLEKIKSFFGR